MLCREGPRAPAANSCIGVSSLGSGRETDSRDGASRNSAPKSSRVLQSGIFRTRIRGKLKSAFGHPPKIACTIDHPQIPPDWEI